MTTTRAATARRGVVTNLLIMYGAQIITSLLSLLPIAYVPLYLDARGLGQISIALSFTGILGTLISLGTANYIVREIARDRECLPEVVSNAITLRVLFVLSLLPVALVLTNMMQYPSQTRLVILLMYISIAVNQIGEPFGLALQAMGKMGWRSAAMIIWELFTVAVTWVVLSYGGYVVGYAIVAIAASCIQVLANLAYFVYVQPFRFRVQLGGLKMLFWGGVPFFLWVLLQTIYTQTSSLFLGSFDGEVAAGWYGAAAILVGPLYAIPSVAIALLLPHFSQVRVNSEVDFKASVSRSLNYILLITLPAALGLALLAGRVIELFNYPPTFQHSIPVLRLLALSLPCTAAAMVIATGVSAMKRERTWSIISLCSLITLVILNISLIPLARDFLHNGAVGAAVAFLGAESVTIGAAWIKFGRSMIERSFMLALSKIVLASGVMVAVVWSTMNLPLAAPIALGAITYSVMALLVKALPQDDLHALQTVAQRHLRPAALALRTALVRSR